MNDNNNQSLLKLNQKVNQLNLNEQKQLKGGSFPWVDNP